MKPMILANCFVDSNIVLYLFDKEGAKKVIAENIISLAPYITLRCWLRLEMFVRESLDIKNPIFQVFGLT